MVIHVSPPPLDFPGSDLERYYYDALGTNYLQLVRGRTLESVSGDVFLYCGQATENHSDGHLHQWCKRMSVGFTSYLVHVYLVAGTGYEPTNSGRSLTVTVGETLETTSSTQRLIPDYCLIDGNNIQPRVGGGYSYSVGYRIEGFDIGITGGQNVVQAHILFFPILI